MSSTVYSVHQPNYLPWLGYFNKLHWSDHFVYLDSVQYPARSYTGRCFINGNGQQLMMSLPVRRAARSDAINEVTVDPAEFGAKHLETLRHCYGKAPFHAEIIDLLSPHLRAAGRVPLSDFNSRLIDAICDYLGLEVPRHRLSDFPIDAARNEMIGDLGCALGCGIYLSGSGARAYIEGRESDYYDRGLTLAYQKYGPPEYASRSPFVPGCSVVDALFNLGRGTRDLIADESCVPVWLWSAPATSPRRVEAVEIVPLSRDIVLREQEKLTKMPHDVPLYRWSLENFLTEKPGKWDFSVMAVRGTTPVGYAVVSAGEDGASVHLHQLIVDADARAGGVGAALLRRAMDTCIGAGRRTMTVKVHRANREALAFYQARGFVVTGQVHRYLSKLTAVLA